MEAGRFAYSIEQVRRVIGIATEHGHWVKA